MSIKEFFTIFLYPENWNVKLNFLFCLLSGAYLFAFRNSVAIPKKICFLLSIIFYYIALGSPISLLAHELFSIHMLEMSLLYFVVPPLLLFGIPIHILRFLLNIKWIDRLTTFCTRPFISLFLFNGLISLYHVPVIFDLMMSQFIYHVISHAILLITSLFMWWPILAPLPEMNQLKPLHRIGLIFANGILLTPACAIITFTDKLLYQFYSEMSPLVPIMSPLHDQQFGGVIMKVTQEIVYITAICFVFFKWVSVERQKDCDELERWKNEQLLQRKG